MDADLLWRCSFKQLHSKFLRRIWVSYSSAMPLRHLRPPVNRRGTHTVLLDSPGGPHGAAMMFKGKTALITGSTSGIGLGMARAFAAQGANVVLNGFGREEEIRTLSQQIAQDHGVQVSYSPADMMRPVEVVSMVNEAIAQFGAVDILVNNAGIQHVAPVETFP